MMKLDNMKLEMKITKELIEVQEGTDLKVQEMVPEEEEEELEEMKLMGKILKVLLKSHNKFQPLDLNI
jgi:hypothetical protein